MSRSDHGKPRRCFFVSSSLERTLYGTPLWAGDAFGRGRSARERENKTAFRGAGPNFERPLLRVK